MIETTRRLGWARIALLSATLSTGAAAQPLAPVAAVDARDAPVPRACTERFFGGHAYYFCAVSLGFDAAQTYCARFGATLGTLGSAYENDLVAETLRSLGRGRALIGHTDARVEGQFLTVDGGPAGFSAWASGEPNNLGDEDCTELSPEGVWNDIACGPALAPMVLCELDAACTVTAFGDHLYPRCERAVAVAPGPVCEAMGAHPATPESEAERDLFRQQMLGRDPRRTVLCELDTPCVRTQFEGRSYFLCTAPATTARAARAQCEARGWRLAVIDSPALDAHLYARMALFRRSHFYFDLRDDDTEGQFYTRLGPAQYTRWMAGEPNNLNDEDCAEVSDSGWNDVPCEGDTKNAWICEAP